MCRFDPKLKSMTDTAAEKISVVLPVRNAAGTVRDQAWRTLEMFEAVRPGPVELVIVDDGSTDATTESLDDLRRELPSVRVIRHSRPRGWEASGQSGLERSTGAVRSSAKTTVRFRWTTFVA